jgi:hypothetical protein
MPYNVYRQDLPLTGYEMFSSSRAAIGQNQDYTEDMDSTDLSSSNASEPAECSYIIKFAVRNRKAIGGSKKDWNPKHRPSQGRLASVSRGL